MSSQSVFLSAAERARGMTAYLRYVFVNGISFAFLSETVTILLAMQFGAGNLEIGLISSALYLTGVVSIFVPMLFGGVKVMRFFFWAWFLRSLVCAGYASVLFLEGQTAVFVIVTTFMLYCILRNSAYFLNQVVMSALSKRSELGKTSARSLVAVNLSSTISRLLSFGVLSIPFLPVVLALLILQGAGSLLNALSASMLAAVPVRDVIEKKSPKDLFSAFFKAMASRERRITLMLNLGGVMLLVLFTFTQPFLRASGMGPSVILAFTVVTAIAVILAGRFGQMFADAFGSKPFLVATHAVLAVLSLLWALLPASLPLALWFILGFVTMFFLGLVTMLTSRLVLAQIPASDKVGFSAVLALFAGIAALAAGLAGGILADFSIAPLTGHYGLTFVFMALVALLNALQSIALEDRGSSSFRETAKILLSLSNLRTFLSIDRLAHAETEREKEGSYLDIEYSPSDIASAEIRRRLHVPLMREKEMVIRSLYTTPRAELLDVLIEEASDPFSWWRQSAIFALGAYPCEKTQSFLLDLLKEDSPYLRSVAIKSLARIQAPQAAELAERLLQQKNLEPRSQLNAIIALSLADHSASWLQSVFLWADPAKGFRFQQHVLVITAKRLGSEPEIESYFYLENQKEGSGLAALAEESRELLLFYENQTMFFTAIGQKDYARLRQWCRQALAILTETGPASFLCRAILNTDDQNPTATDTLAIFYFTYQIHREGPLLKPGKSSLPE